METIQLTGRYKLDKGITVKDPLITIQSIFYDFTNLMTTIVMKAENTQYSHVRELDPAPFAKELTIEEIKAIINAQLQAKKQ